MYGALRRSLEGPFALREVRGRLYETGLLPTEQGTWEASHVRIEPGMVSAGLELDRAGTDLGPAAVIFIGLGAGRGTVQPGYVVVAEWVIDHQSAKETAQETLPQGRAHRAGHRMI